MTMVQTPRERILATFRLAWLPDGSKECASVIPGERCLPRMVIDNENRVHEENMHQTRMIAGLWTEPPQLRRLMLNTLKPFMRQ